MIDWCKIQDKNTGKVGIGLNGIIQRNGKPSNEVICWFPHTTSRSGVAKRLIEGDKKNYVFLKPDEVHMIIVSDIFAEADEIWRKSCD